MLRRWFCFNSVGIHGHATLAKALALCLGCAIWLSPVSAAKETGAPSDPPLTKAQVDLLELAFETATSIPVEPHIKDRSRSQEAVVSACLELGQTRLASIYIPKIDNWRQGTSCADLASCLMENGRREDAEEYVALAERISADAEGWRADRIMSKVAKTYALLGMMEKAEEVEAAVEDSERGRVASVKASLGTDESFDAQIASLDAVLASGNFDLTRNALRTCTEVFNRHYDDPEKRSKVEESMKASWTEMPVFVRIDLLKSLVGFALEHSDKDKALELAREAQELLDGHRWRLEHRIPLAAEVAELRWRAGDVKAAKADAEELWTLFEERGSEIVNIYRAEALCPLARAFVAMGDTEKALSVFKRAVDEGVENPNSRPRAEDLSAICAEMAVCGLEPDAELWARLHTVCEGLGVPW